MPVKYFFKLLLLGILLGLFICLPQPRIFAVRTNIMPPAWAKTKQDNILAAPVDKNPELGAIEERLFFREFSDENTDLRLDRIEKQVFGEVFTDQAVERINRINLALPSTNKDDHSTQTTSKSNSHKKSKENSQPNVGTIDQDDSQRFAAMAARSAEVDKLMAEAVHLWRNKQGAEAIEKFKQIIRLDPQNAAAYFSLGVAWEAKGDLPEAQRNYNQAALLSPDNKDYAAALTAIGKKRGDAAIVSDSEKTVEGLAEDADKAYRSGELLSALDLYKQIDAKAPRQALVKWNIGTIYLRMNNRYLALKYYKEANKLNPTDQHYAQAVARLSQSVDQSFSQSGGDEKPGKQPASKPQDILLIYGVTAKSGKQGPVIVDITPGSRAQQVGLKQDDIIKAVDGNVVTKVKEIIQILGSKPPGQRFQFTIQRNNRLGQILF